MYHPLIFLPLLLALDECEEIPEQTLQDLAEDCGVTLPEPASMPPGRAGRCRAAVERATCEDLERAVRECSR